MNPPPNPRADAARAAMMQHNAPLLQNPVPLPLYPLDAPLPVVRYRCHDDGVEAWFDDPASIGVETKEKEQER